MRTTVLFLIFLITLLEILQVYGQKCPTLKSPKYGRVRIRARGRIAKFRCWRKFTLLGPKIIICSGNKWSLSPPMCVRKGCEAIESTVNMTVTASHKGAVLTFRCVAPLKLTGDRMLTCDGKKWSAPEPICEYEEPGLRCDFEDENICGWQHDTMANFKWQWTSGTTPTRRTGPSYDHTLGKGKNGHYMYMESSPLKKYDKARLQSQYFDATTGSKCFDFWYHMYGQAGAQKVGNLKIYTEELGATGSLREEFSIHGNQGDMWLKGTFSLGERKKSFRFVIEGQKMDSYLSDISIDDVRLYNCSEDYEGTTIIYDETSETGTTVKPAKQTTDVIISMNKVTTDDTIKMPSVVTSLSSPVSELPQITTAKSSNSTMQSSKRTLSAILTESTKMATVANMPKTNNSTVRETRPKFIQGTSNLTTEEQTTMESTASTQRTAITTTVSLNPTTTTRVNSTITTKDSSATKSKTLTRSMLGTSNITTEEHTTKESSTSIKTPKITAKVPLKPSITTVNSTKTTKDSSATKSKTPIRSIQGTSNITTAAQTITDSSASIQPPKITTKVPLKPKTITTVNSTTTTKHSSATKSKTPIRSTQGKSNMTTEEKATTKSTASSQTTKKTTTVSLNPKPTTTVNSKSTTKHSSATKSMTPTRSTQGTTNMTIEEQATTESTASTQTTKITTTVSLNPKTITTVNSKSITKHSSATKSNALTRSTQGTTNMTTEEQATTVSTASSQTTKITTTFSLNPTIRTTVNSSTSTKDSPAHKSKTLTRTSPSTTTTTSTTTPKSTLQSTLPKTTTIVTTESTTIYPMDTRLTKATPTTTTRMSISTKSTKTSNQPGSVDTTENVVIFENITDHLNRSTSKSPEGITPAKQSDSSLIISLMIGAGVCIAFQLIIIAAMYIYRKRL